MNVTVSLSATFTALDDGSYWTSSNVGYEFWTRYLDVFENVRILARVERRSGAAADMLRVDGPRVSVTPLIAYRGPGQFIRRGYAARKQIIDNHKVDDAIIMRIPSTTANIAYGYLRRWGVPYGVEVVGDPEDVFAPGASTHPLSPAFRLWFSRHQRAIVGGAAAVSYVTSERLQRRYPAADTAFTTHYSSIDLGDNAFVDNAPSRSALDAPLKLIFVGSLEKPYKGLDVLILALAQCRRMGLDLELDVLGDGQERGKLEALAADEGVSGNLRFHGRVKGGNKVRRLLDASDIFVLPSRTEGLPRAMIEAMARGLPCIGSAVGGIPELLPEEDLVPPGDHESLAAKLAEVGSDPDRMKLMGERNLLAAQSFHSRILDARRNDFYSHVKLATERWLKTK